ncbi:putative transcription factor interactor and regulator LIM family [Helianthus annuus]|uniref:RING-type E3 ubiquitin transferase n=1 Tax=Helianthus annuus TaxID=4232 RepID=A0A9K3EGM9_HELAN|nr:E3 ubiquitin-protein ligase HAKAI homolog [Helianthus annuus]KAF5772832.1 putative transcription factor interactor and regulator LIM family [Helianthus annuus]KAJ0476408.1 putative transcription factor interactor and regulator LIM family [Helianthus annuus]KAJ0480597.1 putative transcription factor interactor and regulator LIM family [Helianthus annuus]KAJ0497230.1 putative transcription factor interactor and regulator LIM family [Helianthus annuus]KAJ0663240.1 putative transcription factor
MLRIRLRNKAAAAESGSGAKPSTGESVTVACPDHLVLAELPVAKSIGSASGVTLVKTVGQKSSRPLGQRVHMCAKCDFPIAIYGRMIPCEHALCLDCARSDSTCFLCEERIQKIQTVKMMEGMFLCAVPLCLKSFLNKDDFKAHVHAYHPDLRNSKPQKDGNEPVAANTKELKSSDSTVQPTIPRPAQDGEDRTQWSLPQPLAPIRPLMQPNPKPNPPIALDRPNLTHMQQPNFEYPVTGLQPSAFVVPNVMGPGSFGQPFYVGQQVPEAGVQQGSLLGYPQLLNFGPNGQVFDPSMTMNQVGFLQGGPPSQGMNANDGRGASILAANQSPAAPLPPPFGDSHVGDTNHHGQAATR